MEYTILYCDYGTREKKTVVVEEASDMQGALDSFLDIYAEYHDSIPHVLGIYPLENTISEVAGIGVGVNIGELLEGLSEDDLLDEYDDDDDEEVHIELGMENSEAMIEAIGLIGSITETPLFEHLTDTIPNLVPMLIELHTEGDSVFDHEELIESVFGQDVIGALMLEIAKEEIKDGGTGSLLEVLAILARVV